jgi:hypothetical protein
MVSLRNVCCSCALSPTSSADWANSLRRGYTDDRARGWRWCLCDGASRSNTNRNVSVTTTLLPFNNHVSIAHTPHGQTGGDPGPVVIVEGNGTTAAICPADRKVLAKVTIVLGPELVLGAIAVVVAVERVACIV